MTSIIRVLFLGDGN